MRVVFFTLSLLLALNAQILELSQRVDLVKLESQHGKMHRLIENGIWVIAWDKESTALANTYFSKTKMRDDINLIVDTSAIPSGIFSLFVHPRMKKFKHPILFSFDKNYNLTLPYREDSLTLLHIEESKVTKIEFVETQKELEESLK